MIRSLTISRLGIMLAASGLLVSAQTARAQLTITLDSSALTGPPGTVLTFKGVLTNPTGTDISLDGASNDPFNSPQAAGFTFDATNFYVNAPLTLLANTSTADIELFTVTLDAGLPEGTSASSVFRIFSGATGSPQVEVGNAPFTAQALTPTANTPEPGSLALLGAGMGTFSLLAARRLRRRTE